MLTHDTWDVSRFLRDAGPTPPADTRPEQLEHGWRTAKRPGADYFLAYMSQFYEIVLFTTLPSYVSLLGLFFFFFFPDAGSQLT